MSQIVTKQAIPQRANLVACQTGGSIAEQVLNNREFLGISTNNTLDTDGQGVIDAYVIGDGTKTVFQLIQNLNYLDGRDEIAALTARVAALEAQINA